MNIHSSSIRDVLQHSRDTYRVLLGRIDLPSGLILEDVELLIPKNRYVKGEFEILIVFTKGILTLKPEVIDIIALKR